MTPATPEPQPVGVPVAPLPPPVAGPRRSGPSAIVIVVALILVGGLAAFGLYGTGLIGGATPTIPRPGATIGPPTSAPGLSDECIRQIGPLVSTLEDLNSRLAVGLSFSDYSTRVGDVRVAYDRIDANKLDSLCISLVGKPGEDAFNAYVTAYNTWNDCIGNVDCSTDSIDSQLQAQWSIATNLITQIKALLP